MNLLTYIPKLLVLLIFLSMTNRLLSQDNHSNDCGHVTSNKSLEFYKSIKPQIQEFETTFRKNKYAKGTTNSTSSINSIPVKIHIIRNSNGSGGLNALELGNAFSNLNQIYKDAYLEFFMCDGIEYINNDELNNFKRGNEEYLKASHYIPGLINIYFTDNLLNEQGEVICGYSDNIGRNDMLVIKSSCISNNSTLAHELGHFFSLLHTHGPNNVSTELVDGSNCDTDGDGICDTPADPKLDYRTIDDSCNYIGILTDANGDTYTPDTSNIMSYSTKACRTFFSEQQLMRMYAFYMTTKNYLACPSFNANITVDESETCETSATINFKSTSDNITAWQWDVDNDGIIDYTTKNVTHTFEAGIYDVVLTVSNKEKTIKKLYKNYIKIGTHSNKIDENFESFNLLDTHGWTSKDVTGNGYYWYANHGETQSRGTGPSNYKNAQNKLNTYLYAEASGALEGDITTFTSPCINVNYQNSELEFSYHMFGENVGELHVDIKTDTGYINDVIDPIYGSQQNNQTDDFITKTINLASYANETINIRFRAIRGSGWEGDIAIDNIFLNTIHTAITDELFKAYPNPMEGNLLYIRSNELLENNSTYIVSNLVGQPLLSGSIIDNVPINFNGLNSGTYILTLINGKTKFIKKIIK